MHSDIFRFFYFRSALDPRCGSFYEKRFDTNRRLKNGKHLIGKIDWIPMNRIGFHAMACDGGLHPRKSLATWNNTYHLKAQIMILCCVEYLIHFARHTPARHPSTWTQTDARILIISCFWQMLLLRHLICATSPHPRYNNIIFYFQLVKLYYLCDKNREDIIFVPSLAHFRCSLAQMRARKKSSKIRDSS